MGIEEKKQLKGEGKQVSNVKDAKVREMRTAETILNIIQDRGKHHNRPKLKRQGN